MEIYIKTLKNTDGTRKVVVKADTYHLICECYTMGDDGMFTKFWTELLTADHADNGFKEFCNSFLGEELC